MIANIKRIGIGYYELENGQIIDKDNYHLAKFLGEQMEILNKLIKELNNDK